MATDSPSPKLLTKSAFAKLCGVAPASITKQSAQGKPLHPALVGKKIDCSHPVAVAYLKRQRDKEPEERLKYITKKKREAEKGEGDIRDFLEMTLGEVIRSFGSVDLFSDWLTAIKKTEEIHTLRLKAAAMEGELVSRELIKRGIFHPIDTSFTRILADGAKNMSAQLHAKVKGGATVEELELFMQKQLTTYIKPAKAAMVRALKEASSAEPSE